MLREFGTNAASARAVLELGARSMHPDTAAECREALKRLDVPEREPGADRDSRSPIADRK